MHVASPLPFSQGADVILKVRCVYSPVRSGMTHPSSECYC